MRFAPLALTTPIRTYVFGGTRIADRLARDDLSGAFKRELKSIIEEAGGL